MSRFILAAVIVLLGATMPAAASTMPDLDFRQGDRIAAVGLLDADFDYAITNRLSLGATAFLAIVFPVAAARCTYRLSELPNGASIGVTMATGINLQGALGVRVPAGDLVGVWNALWLQPAVIVTFHLPVLNARLSGSLGPYLGWNYFTNGGVGSPSPFDLWLVPNIELSIPFSPAEELTIGGNSLLGLRGTF